MNKRVIKMSNICLPIHGLSLHTQTGNPVYVVCEERFMSDVYLVLGLLQVPTGPQRQPQTMAALSLILTPRQLLRQP